MATGDVPAVVPFRGLALSVSRHPLPSRGGPALSSSPDAFGDYALPGLDTMDIEDEVDPLGRVRATSLPRSHHTLYPLMFALRAQLAPYSTWSASVEPLATRIAPACVWDPT